MYRGNQTPPEATRGRSRSAAAAPAPASEKPPAPDREEDFVSPMLSEPAARIRRLSVERWGADGAVELIGNAPCFLAVLAKVEKFARYNEPILITGESGAGKEGIAKACYLLSWRMEHPFVSVNCPQYLDQNTTISALFGHMRGSFTGAVNDHKGLFETADQGVLFLDEIGDLPLSTQVLLLRALAEGEFKPLGSNETKKFHARFITATNQQLSERMNAKEFREDLFFRLRYFRIELPPLRDRGNDWRLLLDAYLARLNARYMTQRYFSDEALETLASYRWPGNVRELRGIVSMAYSLSSDDVIELSDFQSEIRTDKPAKLIPPEAAALSSAAPNSATPRATDRSETDGDVEAIYNQIAEGKTSFWESVHANFMEREMNREQVKAIVAHGLRQSMGSYRRLCQSLRIESYDYHKFMDFLRHHRLKP